MQLEYQAFGRICGTQVTKRKNGASLPPYREKKDTNWNRSVYSKVENEHKFCKRPPEHEGDCEAEAIQQTRKEIKRKVAYIVGMPPGIDDNGKDRDEDLPGDITQTCFLQALEKIEGAAGRGCLCRLAGHRCSIRWALSHYARGETRQQHHEGDYATLQHGEPAQQFDVVKENELETGAESEGGMPVVVERTTPETLTLESNEQAHQWALLLEAVKRSHRQHTRAVIAAVMFPDQAPQVDRRRVHQELKALRRAVEEVETESRRNFTSSKKTRTI